jgi:hypothetical protein
VPACAAILTMPTALAAICMSASRDLLLEYSLRQDDKFKAKHERLSNDPAWVVRELPLNHLGLLYDPATVAAALNDLAKDQSGVQSAAHMSSPPVPPADITSRITGDGSARAARPGDVSAVPACCWGCPFGLIGRPSVPVCPGDPTLHRDRDHHRRGEGFIVPALREVRARILLVERTHIGGLWPTVDAH